MNNAEQKKPTLEGTDILFECRECGKNLAIDCRGAGLNIHCPQCNSELEVPIPEGFDLSQIDQKIEANGLSENAQTVVPEPVAADAAASADAVDQIKTLQAELQALRAQKQYFARQHGDMLKTVKMVSRQIGDLRNTLDELARMLDDLAGPETDETQQLR